MVFCGRKNRVAPPMQVAGQASSAAAPPPSTSSKMAADLPPEFTDYVPRRRGSVSAECGVLDPATETPIKEFPKTEEQLGRIRGSVELCFLFRDYDSTTLKTLIGAFQEQAIASGTEIIKEGDDGDFFYVVDSGKFGVFKDGLEGCLKTEIRGGYFGELALMYSAPRAATVKAMEDSVVWSLDRESFRSLASRKVLGKRTTHEKVLGSVPFLQTLESVELAAIADAITVQELPAGSTVFKQGDVGDRFYIIETGTVEFVKDNVTVGTATDGGYFGELSILTAAPRAASVVAQTAATLAWVDREAFMLVLGPVKDLLLRDAAKWDGLDPALKELVEAQSAESGAAE